MPNERPVRIDIDSTDLFRKQLYYELKAFCRQYDEKKQLANSLLGIQGMKDSDGSSHGSSISDPTVRSAEVRAKYLADIELIEICAKQATEECPANYDPLLKSVTRGIPYKSIDFYCGINQFTKLRRRFFNILAVRKGNI